MQESALVNCLSPLSERLAVIQSGKVAYENIAEAAVEINLDPYIPLFKDRIVIDVLAHFRTVIWELQKMQSYTNSADVVYSETEDYIISNFVRDELDDYDFALKDYQIKIGSHLSSEQELTIQLNARPVVKSKLKAAEGGALLWMLSQRKIVPYDRLTNLAELGTHLFGLNHKNLKKGAEDAKFGRIPMNVCTALIYELEQVIKLLDQVIETKSSSDDKGLE